MIGLKIVNTNWLAFQIVLPDQKSNVVEQEQFRANHTTNHEVGHIYGPISHCVVAAWNSIIESSNTEQPLGPSR